MGRKKKPQDAKTAILFDIVMDLYDGDKAFRQTMNNLLEEATKKKTAKDQGDGSAAGVSK